MEIDMIIRYSILLLSLGISSPLSASPYFEMDSFISSEPVSIDATSNDWQGDYHPNGEKQTASVWIESGFKKNNWSLGALYREEHQLTFSSDAADLYHTVVTDQALSQNRHYNLELDAYRFRGVGARLAKQFKPKNNLELSVGTSLFYATNLLEGELTGSAIANSADNYSYQFEGDYVYEEDLLFNRPNTESASGVGLALDVAMNWKPTQQTNIALKVKDLAGVIHWRDAPYTKAQANSDRTTTDANGFSSVNPILSGFEGYKSSYTQNLRTSVDLSAQYQFQNTAYTASAKAKYINELNLFALGGSKKLSKGELSFHYWPQIKTLETGFQGKNVGFTFGIDQLDISETQTVWLTLKYQ